MRIMHKELMNRTRLMRVGTFSVMVIASLAFSGVVLASTVNSGPGNAMDRMREQMGVIAETIRIQMNMTPDQLQTDMTMFQSTLPDCANTLGSNTPVPQGFGTAFDLFSTTTASSTGEKPLLIKVSGCVGLTGMPQIEVGNGGENQFIFNSAHVFKNNAWQPIELSQSNDITADSGNPKWLIGKAVTLLPLSFDEIGGERTQFVLAYVCTWTGAEWKCGCSNTACTQPRWQLQQFKLPGTTYDVLSNYRSIHMGQGDSQ